MKVSYGLTAYHLARTIQTELDRLEIIVGADPSAAMEGRVDLKRLRAQLDKIISKLEAGESNASSDS
jgi:hypothetical protein